MNVLGISCFYHDSAACLLRDGRVVAAASEERFTRKKHDDCFPANAVGYCLKEGGITPDDLDYVGFYEKPLLKFERILTSYLATFPRSLGSFVKALPIWLKDRLWIPSLIRGEIGYGGDVLMIPHHLSHAASSFFCSPYREAAILTVDGVGEWATATFGVGRDRDIDLFKEIRFPHSLGLLYTAFTYYLGFKVNSAEYKVMGLAPYGRPAYADRIRENIIEIREDGGFHLNMDYFAYDHSLEMINGRFNRLFGGEPRKPETEITQRHKDIAASLQQVTEEAMLKMTGYLHKETGIPNLCLAGGVALNCVANGRIIRETPYRNVFVQPAAGDAGGSVGIATYIHHHIEGQPRSTPWQDVFLGPEFSDSEVGDYLEAEGLPYHRLNREELLDRAAGLIADQKVVGWFQGRMEFGPRALGNRSILADARNPDNRKNVNLKIKFRESFRPFAPTVLAERASEYFELEVPSPFMLFVAQVRPDHRDIPSVTHLDGSARIQTISREQNPLYYDLLKTFERLTGCPLIINTSFNVRGEPIVCIPAEAVTCFRRTNMDNLVIGNCLLNKEEMPPFEDDIDWKKKFVLD